MSKAELRVRADAKISLKYYLQDDTGAAALVIAVLIMIVASTATMVFLSQYASPTVRELRRLTSSGTNFRTVANALQVAAIQDANQALPCPADPTVTGGTFGTATASVSAVCTIRTRGIVPFRTIGLSEDDVKDSEGNFLTYVVDTAGVSICDGASANDGALQDLNGGSTSLFALISHGANGAGSYSGANQPVANTPSTNELANCPAGHPNCAAPNAGQVRSGPYSDDETGGLYFDDTVYVSDSSKFAADCKDINEDSNTPDGSDQSFNVLALNGQIPNSRIDNVFDGTSQSGANNRSAPQITVNDEQARVVFAAGVNQPTSSCFFYQGDIPLEGSTVRTYGEYFFQRDTSSALGNGLVLAFLGARDSDTTEFAPSNYNDICGGTDQYMGFQDDPVFTNRSLDASLTSPTVLNRFGVEIDTFSHYDGTTNNDSVNNHVAVVARNVQHSGDTVGTDGPVCRSDVTPPFLGATAFGGAAPVGGDQGCRVGPVADWLENGEPTIDGASFANAYTQIRTEAHWHTGSSCDEMTEFRLDVWVFPSGSHCTDSCDDLTTDYSATPDASYCLPQQTGLETVRVGFTTGFPANSSSTDANSSVQRFGFRSDRVDDIPGGGKAYAGDSARSAQATEQEVGTALGYAAGTSVNSTFASARLETGDFSTYPFYVFSRAGTFRTNNNNGLGVGGIGDTNTTLDNIDVAPLEGVEVSEKIVFVFDDLFRRFSVNLRDFGAAEGITGTESVRLRAYNGTTLVGDETIDACSLNSGTGNGNSMNIARDFGENFDRVEVIPDPVDADVDNGFSRFLVRGGRACGASEMCAFDNEPASVIVLSSCSDVDLPDAGGAGSGQSSEITADVLSAELNAAGTNIATGRSWLEFSNLGATILTDRGQLRIQASGTTTDGLGIQGSSTDVSNLLDNGDAEVLHVVFDESWQKLNMTLSRFGGDNNGGATPENAVATFFLDGTQVASESLHACNTGTGTGISATFQIDALPNFNEVRISAANADGGGASQFYVREIRACDALSTFGGTCTTSGTPTCTVSIP